MLPETVTSEDQNPAKNKGGAPFGNRNATLSGVRGWLAIGSYPKGAAYVRRIIGGLRVELATAVCATYGEMTKYQAALVQSACRHEGRALLLTRWLRVETGLTLLERMAVLKEIGNATDSRDRCLKSIGLDSSPRTSNPWDALDRHSANG